MPVSEVTAPYGWGMVVASDRDSALQPPDKTSSEQVYVAGDDVLVIFAEHAQFGDVTIRVWQENGPANEGITPDVSVPMAIPSGVLVIGDVLRTPENTVHIELAPGQYVMNAYFDRPTQAQTVDLVIRSS